MTRKQVLLAALVAMIALSGALTACSAAGDKTATDKNYTGTEKEKPLTYSAPPAMTIDTSKSYTATIETTRGDMVCELFPADAPVTVNSFVFLAREGFYDGVTFHRVVPGFVIQGGDPTGTGRGGPGYKFQDEINSHRHGTGTLAMANAGPDTNGSQFYLTLAPQPSLDGGYTVFGQLIEGEDVMLSIKQGDVIKTIRITES